jgi:multiple sugar transport system substrate-binding protein
VGGPIVVAITGGDADKAADDASEAFQSFLDDEK